MCCGKEKALEFQILTGHFGVGTWLAMPEPAQTPAGAQARASNERDIAMIHSTRAVAERPIARRWLLATGLTLGLMAAMPSAKAQDTIKVGILHSRSEQHTSELQSRLHLV